MLFLFHLYSESNSHAGILDSEFGKVFLPPYQQGMAWLIVFI